jgi:hypothetical protein
MTMQEQYPGQRDTAHMMDSAKQAREPEIRSLLSRLDDTITELTGRVESYLVRTADVRSNAPGPTAHGMPGVHDTPTNPTSTVLGNTLASYNQRLQNCLAQVALAHSELEI